MIRDISEKNLDFAILAKNLDADEKAVLQGRVEGLTYRQISNETGLNLEKVRKIEVKAIQKLSKSTGIDSNDLYKNFKKSSGMKEAMDPVGQADADIDNDGDVDSSDKYLHKRRKAISKAIAKKKNN